MATELRSDAVANRVRIIEAARDAFAENGPDVAVDEIARRAGVGVGTVYRRFPGKAELVRAILEERVSELLSLISGAADEDPLRALDRFFDAVIHLQAKDRGVLRLMAQAVGETAFPANGADLYAAVWRLIRAGQRAGQIRSSVKKADVPALLRMVNGAVATPNESGPDLPAARRCSALLLDGLRAD